MDRWVEARFQVYSSAKLTLLDDPEREELNCRLMDISGSAHYSPPASDPISAKGPHSASRQSRMASSERENAAIRSIYINELQGSLEDAVFDRSINDDGNYTCDPVSAIDV